MKNLKRHLSVWFAWGVILTIGGCGGRAIVPTSYGIFSDNQNIFKIQYPEGWTVESADKINYSRAKFTSGNAVIEVDADLTTRVLLSEMAVTGIIPTGSLDPSSLSGSPNQAHWLERKQFEEERGVKEEKPVPVQMVLGKGLKSEFTGAGAFGGAFHGYRATALNKDKRIRVVCQCPADEWETLKPVFDKVIASLDRL